MDPDARAVLDFWFGAEPLDAAGIEQRMKLWFGGDREQDRLIAERFGELVEAASNGSLDHWSEEPEGRLAMVILLDQFRRSLHRGSPDAFSMDDRALALCEEAMSSGDDRRLDPVHRVFLYMPMQHAEDVEVQRRSVNTLEGLMDEVPEDSRDVFRGFRDYAVLHRDIVERFGRFPHRNRILGRDDTPEEKAYLDDDAPRFGQ